LVPGSRKAPPIGFRSVVGLRQQANALIELFRSVYVFAKWPCNRLLVAFPMKCLQSRDFGKFVTKLPLTPFRGK